MNSKLPLSDISCWTSKLGLLPVPLFSSQDSGQQFILLNGARGNFCLDLGASPLGEQTRSYAWSSNVGHFVAVTGNKIEVQRWDRTDADIERYDHDSVYRSLETFHSHLEKSSPKQDLSVVAHAIRVFRRLRATLGAKYDGLSSLKAFLYLIASTKDGVGRSQLAISHWNMDLEAKDITLDISDANWDSLQRELIMGRQIDSLTPDLALLLRHASGQLFQEAHYEAVFVPQDQLMFDGFPPMLPLIRKETQDVGIHFTPPWLVRTLVEETFSAFIELPNTITIFDPACGSGEFLREALRQLNLRDYPGKVKLIGWDVSRIACFMASFILACEMRDTSATERVTIEIRNVDSLSADQIWPNNVDVVLMNPPFVSWEDMTASHKQYVRDIMGKLMSRRPDLSHAFVWKSIPCLRDRGVIGTVLPASLLDGESAIALRRQLGEQLAPRLIARLGSQILFPGAMIDAALYIAKKDPAIKEPTIAFWADYHLNSNSLGLRVLRKIRSQPNSAFNTEIGEGYSIYLNPSLGHGGESWAPRPYSSWKLMQGLKHLPKAQNLFDVRQGIRTGLNEAFLIEKERWLALPKRERFYFRPAVVNKSIRHGFLTDITYCFYPYGESGIATEGELEKKVGEFYHEYLLPNKEKLLVRASVHPQRWWGLTRPREWQTKQFAKIVSTYFGDAGSFAWDETGDFVVVQGFAWIPKGDKVLPVKISLAYLAVLNSPIFSSLLSAVSNNIGGGQWNLSPKFVNNIAIPDLLDVQVDPSVLSQLAEIGKCIREGYPVSDEKQNELLKIAYRFDWET